MKQNKSGIGSIVSIVVILSIIILGGLYFWGKRVDESKMKEALIGTTIQPSVEESQAAATRNVGPSDDIATIEAELNATNFDNLATEF